MDTISKKNFSKGHNSSKNEGESINLLCTLSDDVLYFYQVL